MLTRMLALLDRVLWSTDILISARPPRRHPLVKKAHPRFVCEQPKPAPRIGKMNGKGLPRLHRTREIVMLLAGLWRRMLEQPRNQTNLLRWGQKQPIAILDLALLATANGQRERGVHKLDAEVERV